MNHSSKAQLWRLFKNSKWQRCLIIIIFVILMFVKYFLSFLFPADNPPIINQPISDIFLTIVMNGPLIEEIWYRGFIIGFMSQISLIVIPSLHYLHLKSRGNNFPFAENDKYFKITVLFRILELLFVFISSYFFSLAHLPIWGDQTIYHYFVSGLIFGFLFLRYGFCLSLVWHVIGNLVGLLSMQIHIDIFCYYLIMVMLFSIFLVICEYKYENIHRFTQSITQNYKIMSSFCIVLFITCSIIYFLNDNNFPNDPPMRSLLILFITGLIIKIDLMIQRVIIKIQLRKRMNLSNSH